MRCQPVSVTSCANSASLQDSVGFGRIVSLSVVFPSSFSLPYIPGRIRPASCHVVLGSNASSERM